MNRAADVIETHISYVFLIGDQAYKLKKPIKTPFLDYSTREARHWACEREVELRRYIFERRPSLAGGEDTATALLELVADFETETGVSTELGVDQEVAPALNQKAHDVHHSASFGLCMASHIRQCLECEQTALLQVAHTLAHRPFAARWIEPGSARTQLSLSAQHKVRPAWQGDPGRLRRLAERVAHEFLEAVQAELNTRLGPPTSRASRPKKPTGL